MPLPIETVWVRMADDEWCWWVFMVNQGRIHGGQQVFREHVDSSRVFAPVWGEERDRRPGCWRVGLWCTSSREMENARIANWLCAPGKWSDRWPTEDNLQGAHSQEDQCALVVRWWNFIPVADFGNKMESLSPTTQRCFWKKETSDCARFITARYLPIINCGGIEGLCVSQRIQSDDRKYDKLFLDKKVRRLSSIMFVTLNVFWKHYFDMVASDKKPFAGRWHIQLDMTNHESLQTNRSLLCLMLRKNSVALL